MRIQLRRVAQHLFFPRFVCKNRLQRHQCRITSHTNVKKKYIIFLIFFAILVLVITRTFERHFSCSVDEEGTVIQDVCDLYNQKQAFGNLCDKLCVTKEILPLNCITHHNGKEIVIISIWNGSKIMIKSDYRKISNFDQIYYSDHSKVPAKVYPDLDVFLDIIIQSLSYNLNSSVSLDPKSKIIDLIWTFNYSYLYHLPIRQQEAAMNNIWYLMQQSEYMLSKIYASHQVFPKIIGTCGHVYAVEYLTPVDSYFGVLHPSWRYPFNNRSHWALDLIRLFENFDRNFHSVLHICDVKVGHFGFTTNGELRLLDLDMAYFEETLRQNMVAPGSCRADHDCAFIDCHGTCKNRLCQNNITNNNMQRLCTNIFYGYFGQEMFGLLGSPNKQVEQDLRRLVLLCMKSPAAAEVAIRKLKTVLKKGFSIK